MPGPSSSPAPTEADDTTAQQHQGQTASDIDIAKLIQALNAGFTQLVEQNKEQSEKLQRAVEALKPTVVATDSKSTFWNAYKTIADEYDRELLQKWGTDLDTSLIFAGLFSGITSAFIILIQPGIQLHGTPSIVIVAQSILYISLGSTLLAALLAVLGKQWLMYYSAAGERGSNETRGLERQRKLDGLRKWKFDEIMQIFPLLLQFGLLLFAVALSVYLWTIHLSIAIIVFGMTSVGFLAYIALLLSTVVFPDSPFHSPLAPLIARIIFVAHLVSTQAWIKLEPICVWVLTRPLFLLALLYIACWVIVCEILKPIFKQVLSACIDYFHRSRNLLPYFSESLALRNTGNWNDLTPLFDPALWQPSPEMSAIAWVLETSTELQVVTAAAELAVGVQWSIKIDIRPQLTRLRDSLLMCFEFGYSSLYANTIILYSIREGMSLQALHIGRAYCTLRCVYRSMNLDNNLEPQFKLEWDSFGRVSDNLSPELANTFQILAGIPDISYDSKAPRATKWPLYVIPSLYPIPSLYYQTPASKLRGLKYFLNQFKTISDLDPSSFTSYLFCVISFLSPIYTGDVVLIDKSQFQLQLFQQLFKALQSSVETEQISMDMAVNIVDSTRQLASRSMNDVWPWSFSTSIIFEFCRSIPHSRGWVDVVLAAGHFIEEDFYIQKSSVTELDGAWANTAMEEVCIPTGDNQWDSKTITGVSALLGALLFYYKTTPTIQTVHLLLHALLIPGNISKKATVLLLRSNIRVWFLDDEMRAILQNASVWSSLSDIIVKHNIYPQRYIELGHTLAGIPDWQPHIQKELCSWITIFFLEQSFWNLNEQYSLVLTNVFKFQARGYTFVGGGERALGLSLIALSQFWEDFDFAGSGYLYKCVAGLKCVCLTGLRNECIEYKGHREHTPLTPYFKKTFFAPLASALNRVAIAAGKRVLQCSSNGCEETIPELKEIFQSITNIVEDITGKFLEPIALDRDTNYDEWRDLVNIQIDALEKAIGNMSISGGSAVVDRL